jgi:hypothetical protein
MKRLTCTLAALTMVVGTWVASKAKFAGAKPGAESTVFGVRNSVAKSASPFAFVPNAGQMDQRVRYSARTAGAAFYFNSGGAVFTFTKGKKGHALQLTFPGANPAAEPTGALRGTGTVNYLIGGDATRWHTGLPTYGEIVYRDLWPGIDLAFRGKNGELKYEFRVAPGADAANIRLAYRGIKRLSIGENGDLRIHTELGILHDSQPVSYQEIDGKRVAVASRYTLAGKSYGFETGDYDRSRPLVIDPGLDYSTYLGGSGHEQAWDIAVDALGCTYITGDTFESPNFPTTVGAFDASPSPPLTSGTYETFVTKFDPSGAMVYSTYLGSSGFLSPPSGIAVDNSGSAYVVGGTGPSSASAFPITPGAFDVTPNGNDDAFVIKLNPSGSALEYSTYIGGANDESAFDIAVDATGSAYITGRTGSLDFPTTPGAFDRSANGSSDAFVTKLNPAGNALEYSTYLGGNGGGTSGIAIAINASGNAYVTGVTTALFPITPGAVDPTRAGTDEGFVTKLNLTGTALEYATYLGGEFDDQGNAIAVDSSGTAYVTGSTNSRDFPTTACALDRTRGGTLDAFVTKLNPTGTAFEYSTYLGGAMNIPGPGGSVTITGEIGNGIVVDASGNAVVTGGASSPDFPITADAFDATVNAGDVFVTRLSASGNFITYSTFLGGSDNEHAIDIARDSMGAIYVTGTTSSPDFPVTPGAFDVTFEQGNLPGKGFDVFVTKLTLPPVPAELAAIPNTLQLTPLSGQNPAGTSATVTANVGNVVGNPLANVIVHFSVTGSRIVSGSCITGANGQCAFSYSGPAFNGSDSISGFLDTNNDGLKAPCEPSATVTNTWTGNGPPTVADPGNQTNSEGEAVSLAIIASDSDGNELTFTAIGLPAGLTINPSTGIISGTVDFSAGGSYDDDGNPIPARAYSVTVTVFDGLGSSSRSFGWTVINVNGAPVVQPASATTGEDTTVQITLAASDPDGEVLAYTVTTNPTHGTVTLSGGVVTYTPAPDYFGPDTFSFRASDGTSSSNVATVSINVSPVNDTPIAQGDSTTTAEDTPVNISVRSNDSDVDGDVLAIVSVAQPTHGVAVINPDGTITYTPAANFSGADSFTYLINDGHGGTATATVNLTVAPINDPPAALDGATAVDEDTQIEIMLVAMDVDGPAPGLAVVNQPINGTLSAIAGNKVIYTPNPNFNGVDAFTFIANDGAIDSNIANVMITVVPIADAPVLATVGNHTVAEGALLSLELAASDPDGGQLTFSASGLPTGATLDPTTGSFSWTPNFNQAGSYTVTFSVIDPTGRSASETITIVVSDVGSNLGPVCSAAYPSIDQIWSPDHRQQLISIFGVTDPDDDPLTITIRRIVQDEPTNTNGDGNTWIDGGGLGSSQAWVRAERAGTKKVSENGRIYEIFFDASDGRGKSCTGSVKVGVPHDQGRGPAVDDGKRYDSTVAGGPCLNCNP